MDNSDKKTSTKEIFEERSRHHGLRAVLDPNDQYGQRNLYLHHLCNRLILDAVPRTAERILDFGCGNGRVIRNLLRTNSKEIWGVDVSEGLIQEAKTINSGNKKLHLETIKTDPPYGLQSNYFDVGICCWVFQHITEDDVVRKIFGDLGRIIKPGCRLIVLDRMASQHQLEYLKGEPYTAIRTIEEEKSLAESGGFAVQSTRIAWIHGRFWQKVLQKFPNPIWWPFIPLMAQFDLNFDRQPFPLGEQRVECLYTMIKI